MAARLNVEVDTSSALLSKATEIPTTEQWRPVVQ